MTRTMTMLASGLIAIILLSGCNATEETTDESEAPAEVTADENDEAPTDPGGASESSAEDPIEMLEVEPPKESVDRAEAPFEEEWKPVGESVDRFVEIRERETAAGGDGAVPEEAETSGEGKEVKNERPAASAEGAIDDAAIGDLGASGGGEGYGGMGLKGSGSGGGGGVAVGSVGAGISDRSGSAGGKATGRSRKSSKFESGQLTAGEWEDLEQWGFWQDLYDQSSDQSDERPWDWRQYEETWKMETRRRIPVRVTHDGEGAADVTVAFGEPVWRARTDNRGRAELFVRPFGGQADPGRTWRLVVGGEGEATTAVVREVEPRGERYRVELSEVRPSEMTLDMMFVVDTTGSMSDELRYLQSELESVVERVQRHFDPDVSIRISVNFYRDEGDDYVVKSNPFTTDLDAAVEQIGRVEAAGGGDKPEAVDRALVDAVDGHEWRAKSKARLLFLVGDAPPHENDEVIGNLQRTVGKAAGDGIRIVPVTGSGIDKSAEFLMRSIAIATGGTYVFLTDDSGIGDSHIEPTIGEYEVNKLNDLLVAVTARYLR